MDFGEKLFSSNALHRIKINECVIMESRSDACSDAGLIKKKKGPPAFADNPLTLTLTLCKYKITS